MDSNHVKGLVMVICGFVMILVNALSYLLGWNTNFTPLGIIGLVFVAVGMKTVKGK
jgi:hypothetical protein